MNDIEDVFFCLFEVLPLALIGCAIFIILLPFLTIIWLAQKSYRGVRKLVTR